VISRRSSSSPLIASIIGRFQLVLEFPDCLFDGFGFQHSIFQLGQKPLFKKISPFFNAVAASSTIEVLRTTVHPCAVCADLRSPPHSGPAQASFAISIIINTVKSQPV
jgi:hypothetical protein